MLPVLALAELQVLRRVVLLVAVDVMHGLALLERATELASHHQTMFEDVAVVIAHGSHRIVWLDPDSPITFASPYATVSVLLVKRITWMPRANSYALTTQHPKHAHLIGKTNHVGDYLSG